MSEISFIESVYDFQIMAFGNRGNRNIFNNAIMITVTITFIMFLSDYDYLIY